MKTSEKLKQHGGSLRNNSHNIAVFLIVTCILDIGLPLVFVANKDYYY